MTTLGLVSHDHKKVDLTAWANYNRATLQRFRVVSTATTGRLLAELIRAIFRQSHVFRGVKISDPLYGLEGEVRLEVGFDGGPAEFSAVATSPQEAYAILYELACTMVEAEKRLARSPSSA